MKLLKQKFSHTWYASGVLFIALLSLSSCKEECSDLKEYLQLKSTDDADIIQPLYVGLPNYYKGLIPPDRIYDREMMIKSATPYCKRLINNSTILVDDDLRSRITFSQEKIDLEKEHLVIQFERCVLEEIFKNSGDECKGLIGILALDNSQDSRQTIILVPHDANGKAMNMGLKSGIIGVQRWPVNRKSIAELAGTSHDRNNLDQNVIDYLTTNIGITD